MKVSKSWVVLVVLMAATYGCRDGGGTLSEAGEACLDMCEQIADCSEAPNRDDCEDICVEVDEDADDLRPGCEEALLALFDCVDGLVCDDVLDTPHINTISELEHVIDTEFFGCEDESDDVEARCEEPS